MHKTSCHFKVQPQYNVKMVFTYNTCPFDNTDKSIPLSLPETALLDDVDDGTITVAIDSRVLYKLRRQS